MKESSSTTRAPIVAVMGHIDHGKSTLLDYIRKTKVVDGEAGGITQHLSAYEISVPYQDAQRKIVFLDTPGHAAFTGMRERGASAADIAILVVSAEDGVKAQTLEALATIRAAAIPFVVAINKIDKPGANVERVKLALAEHDVLVEGFGGNIPFNAVSALAGTGVTDLLETILLVGDVEGLSSHPAQSAEGIVIESHMDPKRGRSATIIIKDGTLRRGQFVVAGGALVATRIMEDFLGKTIDEAGPSTAVRLVGFDGAPDVGSNIAVFDKKRDAEEAAANAAQKDPSNERAVADDTLRVIPFVIKADAYGTAEAIECELGKIAIDGAKIKILSKGVGAISENDVRMAQSDKTVIIIGFNVDLDARAREANEVIGATVMTFDVIYRLIEWCTEMLQQRRMRKEVREVIGSAKVLKVFSRTKDKQVIGCRVETGAIAVGAKISVLRRDFALASGTIIEVQQAKQKVKEVRDGECGALIECKTDIAPGDVLEAFMLTVK